jgi:putative transposase
VRYGFVARHQSIWPVRTMCRMLEVSPAGFYDWRLRVPSDRSRVDARLAGLIRTSFLASDKTYGSPRIWRDLYDWGERCGKTKRLPGRSDNRPASAWLSSRR